MNMETNDLNSILIKPRVLVVDDSKLLRKAANKILEREFDVKTAEDGEDGWEQIAVDDTIQVVFCDLMMPVLDGYELLERIRSSPKARISELPIIIVTGGESEEAKEKAFSLGATDFITKPFNSIDVLARAKAHSNNQQKTQELAHSNKLLAQTTTIDPTTGLGNKLFFVEKIKQDLSFSRRHRLPLSLIIFEFTEYNTLFIKNGKKVPEKIMQQVAKHISSALRTEDVIARVGTSHIVVTLLSTTGGNAEALCQRISGNVNKVNFLMAGKRLDISLRYGAYVPASDEILTADEMLHKLIASLGAEMPENARSDVAINGRTPKLEETLNGNMAGRDKINASRVSKVINADKEFDQIIEDLKLLYLSSADDKKVSITKVLRAIQ